MASSVVKNRNIFVDATHIPMDDISAGSWGQGSSTLAKTGYICIPFQVGEYRSGAAFAIKMKQVSNGKVVFDYENLGTSTITNPTPTAYWLCIPI